MKHRLFATIGIVLSLCLGSGCESKTDIPAPTGTSADAGPNRRLKFKEEYKDMIGKDGRPLWKPGMKTPPAGLPKK